VRTARAWAAISSALRCRGGRRVRGPGRGAREGLQIAAHVRVRVLAQHERRARSCQSFFANQRYFISSFGAGDVLVVELDADIALAARRSSGGQ
jgi:hypothetical protein